jgi:hypothetical protein
MRLRRHKLQQVQRNVLRTPHPIVPFTHRKNLSFKPIPMLPQISSELFAVMIATRAARP